MKKFNEKHEVIIYSEEKPCKSNVKIYEICNHFHKVNNLEFYQEKTNGEFTRVILTRAFILDLAEQIKEIESNIFESQYYPSIF